MWDNLVCWIGAGVTGMLLQSSDKESRNTTNFKSNAIDFKHRAN